MLNAICINTHNIHKHILDNSNQFYIELSLCYNYAEYTASPFKQDNFQSRDFNVHFRFPSEPTVKQEFSLLLSP